MTKFEKWVARWLVQRLVKQGNHQKRITQLFAIVHDEARLQFNEDNEPTLYGFLQECFDKSIRKGSKY